MNAARSSSILLLGVPVAMRRSAIIPQGSETQDEAESTAGDGHGLRHADLETGRSWTGRAGRPYRGDVAIEGGRIAAVGDLSSAEAAERIDAAGCVVSPGFIDMHSHSDVTMLDDPMGDSKARQGVTTEVCGNCGSSPYPAGMLGSGEALRKVNPTHPIPHSPTEWAWTDFDGWAEYTERAGIGLNIIPQVGHGAVKAAAGAPKSRPANPDELAAMKRLTAESIEQGAWALTNGLTGAHFEARRRRR